MRKARFHDKFVKFTDYDILSRTLLKHYPLYRLQISVHFYTKTWGFLQRKVGKVIENKFYTLSFYNFKFYKMKTFLLAPNVKYQMICFTKK